MQVTGIYVDYIDEPGEVYSSFPGISFCVTVEGIGAVVPESAAWDDEIWVLHGAAKPVLLRPDGYNRYGFLG